MSKQTPAELAWEQTEEINQWIRKIQSIHSDAFWGSDFATVAHLHRALAGVMRNYQKFQKKQEGLQAEVIQHMIDEAKKEEASE